LQKENFLPCWSGFTKEAGEYAKRNGIRVVSGGELV